MGGREAVKKYIVTLTEEERAALHELIRKGKAAARKLTAEERDILRAELIRTQLAAISNQI